MFIRNFDEFFSKFEDLLAADPFTSRLVVKYDQKKRLVCISLRSDRKVISFILWEKNDAKKLETLLHKAAEVFTNRKGAETSKTTGNVSANSNDKTITEAGVGGKKKKKGPKA